MSPVSLKLLRVDVWKAETGTCKDLKKMSECHDNNNNTAK